MYLIGIKSETFGTRMSNSNKLLKGLNVYFGKLGLMLKPIKNGKFDVSQMSECFTW